MEHIADDILMHYGVKRRSGRYPWGSGDSPYQHSGDFLSRVQELKKQGLTDNEIIEEMELDDSVQYRAAKAVAKNERRRLDIDRIHSLQKDGLNNSEIGRRMGISESTVRSLLNEGSAVRMNQAMVTADILKKELSSKRMLDVGAGVERELGISKTKLQEALFMLEAEGYKVYGVGIPQVGNKGKQTNTKVLCSPDVAYKDLYSNMGDIKSVRDYHSIDGGKTWDKREYPASIDSNRVMINYGDKGGSMKDGVIEIRRGVKDLDLGNSHYAQVRILVDGTHYLKGMAMYSDDIPDGVDILFNTNKKSGTPKMDVLKPITDDPDNPFGAYIKANGQSKYDDPKGNYIDPITGKKQSLSAINKLKEEGEWDTMSRNLSSQFLVKQPLPLIKKQLNLTYADREAELKEIRSLTNPTIKKKMLLEFASACDSATIHLKAAALPRQETRVILPLTKMKENEVYAPYLKDGEKVVLIRFPHAGTFEIPELTVNNKNKSAKRILGDVTDAIGINSKVAEQLSGADFDGDTVVVIPVNDRVKIKTDRPLSGLKNFDPKTEYSTEGKTGVRLMTKAQTQREMGIISNLITDMTLRGAPEQEVTRAVKHSMVVIDAYKHKLDYKQSEKDNGIAELKQKWQVTRDSEGNVVRYGGASTLVSKRKQTVQVPERKGSIRIDPKTGKLIYKESGRTYVDKKGNTVLATTSVNRILIEDDARVLSSGNPKENAYADYINKMKALANTARKESLTVGKLEYNPSARKVYLGEVESLNNKLRLAQTNAPRERRAQAIANSRVKAKKQDNPGMDKKELSKIERAAINDARAQVSASGKDTRINITDREWEAIQVGAITNTKLEEILKYTDPDAMKKRALPKTTNALSGAKQAKLAAMIASGHYTIAEMADALGVSTSTVSNYMRK